MIQFNLLPDVKLEYIKAQRQRRLVMSIALITTAAAVSLLLTLIVIGQLEKKHSDDLSKDIKANSNKLKAEPQIDKVLTIQSQLNALTGLHEQKPAMTRVFGYLNQVTPNEVSINSMVVDATNKKITITGSADALSSVNKYIDTLKFTTYSTADAKGQKAFSDVVLTSFGVSASSQADANGQQTSSQTLANYTVDVVYADDLFNIMKDVQLTVPNTVTTRSTVNKPTDLFTGSPTTKEQTTTQGAGQ